MDIKYYLKFWLSFKPKSLVTHKFNSIYDIEKNLDSFKRIKLFVFDVDDTIGEHKGAISSNTLDMFSRLIDKGFKIALLSNSPTKRKTELNKIFKPYKIYVEPTSLKPSPVGYLNVCKKLSIEPKDSVMVGEKLGTDIYGAFLAGYKFRIMVKPYSKLYGGKRAPLIERIMRQMENSFITF